VAASLREAFEGAIISIDGKALRHSFDNTIRQKYVHLVSTFDGTSGVTLAQVATATNSNEITAIPKLLKLVDISGATVTLDAMGYQTKIMKDIVK
jgi:predicted transposase YbfD/YdcC